MVRDPILGQEIARAPPKPPRGRRWPETVPPRSEMTRCACAYLLRGVRARRSQTPRLKCSRWKVHLALPGPRQFPTCRRVVSFKKRGWSGSAFGNIIGKIADAHGRSLRKSQRYEFKRQLVTINYRRYVFFGVSKSACCVQSTVGFQRRPLRNSENLKSRRPLMSSSRSR